MLRCDDCGVLLGAGVRPPHSIQVRFDGGAWASFTYCLEHYERRRELVHGGLVATIHRPSRPVTRV